jgi:polyhydroxyalkanoate synthesis repressor PhaR
MLLGMARRTPPAPERVIKRYGNRKLYDTAARRYVALPELARLVAGGAELRVLDQRSGEDVTALVLAQLVLEQVRERSARIPGQLLARLVRLGAAPAAAWREWAPQPLGTRVREEAERIVAGLVARGRLSLDEAVSLRQEIASAGQALVSEAQRGFEQRLERLMERLEREGGLQPALRRVRAQLLAFEAALPKGRRTTPPRRKRVARRSRHV